LTISAQSGLASGDVGCNRKEGRFETVSSPHFSM